MVWATAALDAVPVAVEAKSNGQSKEYSPPVAPHVMLKIENKCAFARTAAHRCLLLMMPLQLPLHEPLRVKMQL